MVAASFSTARNSFQIGAKVVRLVLDSEHADYAAIIAALTVISTEDADHDSTIKVVTAEDPGARTGDLAPIHRSNIGEGVFKDEYVDAKDFRERGRPLLGDMAGTPYPEMTGVRYIRPDKSGGYGDGNGMTPGDAFNGPRDQNINGGASRVMQGGIKYICCGGVIHKSGSSFSTTANSDIDFADASATERVEFGCDHPLMPAIILPTFTHTPAGAKGDAWVHEGGNIYSQADWGNGTQTPFQNALIVTSAVDPTESIADIMENAFYIEGASETTLNAGEWFTSDGIKMYVRMLDDQAPPAGFNIANRWDGLGGYWLDLSAAKNIKLNRINLIAGTDGVGTVGIRNCDDLTVAGGRIALADNAGYFLGSNATHWKFCAATYGRRTYAIDDDIMYDGDVVDENHRLVRELITDKGSSASTFANMKDDWVLLRGQGNGPGLNNNTATNKDNIDGLYVVDCNAVLSNSRGDIVSYAHDDGHSLSARNGDMNGRTWQRFVLMRGGAHYDCYVSATGESNAPYSGSGTNISDNISQDFLILGDNGRLSADEGKASAGIVWEADNDSVRYLDGTGVKTGNIFRRFVIAGIKPTDMNGAALNLLSEQEAQYLDYVIEDCNYHYQMSRNFQESVPYVALVKNSVVTEVTENLLLGTGGGVATTLDLSVGDYIIFGSIGSFRRVELLLTTAATGTYTLAFEELTTGDTWAAVSNLSDGTSNLTNANASNRRVITWNRNDSMIETDFDTATSLYFFRIRLASGSFTTNPVISRAAGRQVGSALYSRRATVRDLAVGWNATASNATPTNSSYVDIDDFTLRLLSGQDKDTAEIFNDGFHTFAEWQSQTSGFYVVKSKTTTDAPKDSNHGSNVTLDDIEEVA